MIVQIGTKKVGKTFFIKQKLSKLLPKRVLILDIADEYQEYNALLPTDIAKFLKGGDGIFRISFVDMSLEECENIYNQILKDFRGGWLICEEAAMATRGNRVPIEFRSAIRHHKENQVRMLINLRSLSQITPEMLEYAEYFNIYKKVEYFKNFKSKTGQYHKLFLEAEKMLKGEDNYAYKSIDMDNKRIVYLV